MWYYTVQYQHTGAKSYNVTDLNMIHKNSALLKFLLLETSVLCRRNNKRVLYKQKINIAPQEIYFSVNGINSRSISCCDLWTQEIVSFSFFKQIKKTNI